MISVPDLLRLTPAPAVDRDLIADLLELSFMGKEIADDLDRALAGRPVAPGGWQRRFFADDLFLADLVRDGSTLVSDGREYKVNQSFLVRTLAAPPTTLAGIRFRQEIVEELDRDAALFANAHRLYRDLAGLSALLRLPGRAARLDINTFRLDVLRQARRVIDWMVAGFAEAGSGLRRLHEAGLETRGSREYQLLAALLDYDRHLSTLNVDIGVGATGRVTSLEVRSISENRSNPFYSAPWRRLVQRLSLAARGYGWDPFVAVGRLIESVFTELAPRLTPLIELTGHLELYLTSFDLRSRVRAAGLEMTLANCGEGGEVELDDLFNPLLLRQPRPAVPCSLRAHGAGSVTIVTGPNSGGKTRLLQGLGLAQVLGQSGLFTPAARARLPVVPGLFVSLIQREAVDQAEGRLGRELLRVRAIFEAMDPGSMVILDELCSGTNPSEGIEVFSVVLRLLEQMTPLAFICTHFLDYARGLEHDPPIGGLRFLQAEVDSHHGPTYQFVPGVAATSLAQAIAERLGVTFEEMSRLIARRLTPRP